MSLDGNDLKITNSDGESHGYVLVNDRTYGEPVAHSKSSPNVPGTGGYSTPAQAGGQYDVRDSEGDKAITHLDWTLGAGQRSLDAPEASPFKFWDSKCVDISRPGEMRLLQKATYTDHVAANGPVYAALGYFFLGKTAGALESSPDGVTWTACEITASPSISGLINSFTTDGAAVYFSVSTGANKGIWKGTYNGTAGHLHFEFAKYGTVPSTEAIKGLAFNGGQLFASVYTAGPPSSTRVAQVNVTTGAVETSSGKVTPVMFNAMTHVALCTAGNACYWVVSQGSRSFVYKISYDVDTKAMTTEQFMEMASGFVATCAVGYLSTLYIGGYYESQTEGVGRGAVYIGDSSGAYPLFDIGDLPEKTVNPSAPENDNRIFAICEAGKDLYFTTNRGVYRWDIDGTGYSHAFDLNSGDAGETEVVWNAGSLYSYDGTDLTNADPPHGRFPSGWTQADTDTSWPNRATGAFIYTDAVSVETVRFADDAQYNWDAVTTMDIIWTKTGSSAVQQFNKVCSIAPYGVPPQNWEATFSPVLTRPGTGYVLFSMRENVTSSPTWTHVSGVAAMVGGTTVLTSTPAAPDELDNALGSTFEIVTTAGHAGDIIYDVQDGTKWARFIIGATYTKLAERVQSYTVVPAVPETSHPYSPYVPAYQVWSGNYFWNYGDSAIIPAGEYIGVFHANASYPDGWYETAPVVKTASNSAAKTTRCVLLGANATITVNGDAPTALTTANIFSDATKLLTLTLSSGVSIDQWNLNSKDAYPSGSETETLGYAGVAYNKGLLLSPYTVPSYAAAITVTSASIAAASVITTVEDHGFETDDYVVIVGCSSAGVNGTWQITRTAAKTFTIPYNNASLGAGGYAYDRYLCPDGIALSGSDYADSGYLVQSESSFHSGSLLKDFRCVDVAHDYLPVGATLSCTIWIDGESFDLTPVYGDKMTRFVVDLQGYSVKTRLTLAGSTTETPVVKAVNLVWDFVKTRKHVYTLNCWGGAHDGRWAEDPLQAIQFLFSCADARCTFEDAYAGSYSGSIDEVQLLGANRSQAEGYSGVVKVSVRETA